MKRTVIFKILKIAGNVLLYLFLALCLFAIVLTITAKKDSDGAMTVFGYQMRVVLSDSMEECEQTDVSEYDVGSIPVKSLLFIKVVPEDEEEAYDFYKGLKKGDVLTFRYVIVRQETITHRIVEDPKAIEGGFIFTLEGDNKNADTDVLQQIIDTTAHNSPNYVIGKVTGQSYFLGLVVYALSQPIGLALIVIIPCLIIIAIEVVKIISTISEGKKKDQAEHEKRQADEIEELKRQLAQLKGESLPTTDSKGPPLENKKSNDEE